MLHDNRNTHGYTATPKDLPSPIRDALSRIAGDVDGRCATLSTRCRDLLSKLVRCASYTSPTDSIRVRNETLSLQMGTSVRTIGRLKSELEAAGWIKRRQVKSRRRGMQVADTWLTGVALAALGLGKGAVDKCAQRYPQARPMRRPPAADASQTLPHSFSKRQSDPSGQGCFDKIEDQKTECSSEQGSGKPLSAAELDILHELQKEFGEHLDGLDAGAKDFEFGDAAATAVAAPTLKGVPNDLVPLALAGLTLGAIRKLMGLASKVGTRLGDVVAVAGQHILKARRAYSYVLKLLRSGKDWAALAAHNPRESKLARKDDGDAWRLTPQEALRIGVSAHALLADSMCALSPCGAVWSIREGVICEAPLSRVERGDWGTPAAHRGTAEDYERLAQRIVAHHESGELRLMSSSEVVCYAAEEAVLSSRLRAAVVPGLSVVDQRQGLAWRFGLHGLEQAELRVLNSRAGARYLPWAHQMQPEFELRLAKLWREGQAVVVGESDLLEIAATRNAAPILTRANSQPSRPAADLLAAFLPKCNINYM